MDARADLGSFGAADGNALAFLRYLKVQGLEHLGERPAQSGQYAFLEPLLARRLAAYNPIYGGNEEKGSP